MNLENHTGTLFSFCNEKKDFYYHTSDHEHLREIVSTGFLTPGRPVNIEGEEYTIQRIYGEVLAGVGDDYNEQHHGENNPYSVQLFIVTDHP